MGALTGAVVLLGVIVIYQLLLTFGLIRRLRHLEQTGMSPPPTLPAAGTGIPPFEVPELGGGVITERDLVDGMAIAAFFSPQCPACERVKSEFDAAPPSEPIYAFITRSETDGTEGDAFAEALRSWARVGFLEHDSVLSEQLAIRGFPTLIALQRGIVVASAHNLRLLRQSIDAKFTSTV